MASRRPIRARTSPARSASNQSAELLFEIGTEELPYQFIPPALASLAANAERLLKEQRLAYGSITTLGTPRRLAVVVEALTTKQAPAVSEAMGPSKAVAFDAEGKPTKAALGFAAGQRITVDQLEVRPTPKGEYVFAVKRDAGRPATAVLPELLVSLVASLSFPKAMRWNASGIRFARPVRWLTAIYGGRVVDVEIGGVRAGNQTWGHRHLGPASGRPLTVKDFKGYLKALAQHGVDPDPNSRRSKIVKQLNELARSARGLLHHDDELLEQAVFTVEAPQAVLGTFQREYLTVPKAVLMTAMKEHQGFFSVVGHDGSLLPRFISVANMQLQDMGLIRAGNERVLAARLADARFFFNEDRKLRLEDRVAKLEQVTFHQRLGTLRQKTERVRGLAGHLARAAGHPDLASTCERAAMLSKADLLTGMVGEFPTLQGVMGAEYARHDGEPEVVCVALGEHYLPAASEGDLPKTLEGKILSLADRLDSLAAFFYVGLVPSGSEDPYALRRHATAVVRILVEGGIRMDISDVLGVAVNQVADAGFKAAAASDPRRILVDFLFERLRHYGRTVLNVRGDVMEAVLRPAASLAGDLADLVARMTALQGLTGRPEFDPLMVGFKRAHRIVEKEKWTRSDVDAARFQHPSESELYRLIGEAERAVSETIARRDYPAALDGLVTLKPAIDAFFTDVMVNTEDQTIRANRLSLLATVDRVFMSYADLSQIAVQGG